MALLKEKVAEAMKILGSDCSWQSANKWFTQKYGKDHGICDSSFYNARSDIRLRGGAAAFLASRNGTHSAPKEEPMKEAPVTNEKSKNLAPDGVEHSVPVAVSERIEAPVAITETPVPPQVTLDDVRKIAPLVRQMGEARLLAALEVLRELKA